MPPAGRAPNGIDCFTKLPGNGNAERFARYANNSSAAMTTSASPPLPSRHHWLEDGHALLMGVSFSAFGLVLLKAAGLVTGGVAGMALVISYLTGWPVGPLFAALSAPFFILAQRRLGLAFTIKSLVTVLALAGFTSLMPSWARLDHINPIFAAIFGGSLIGMGVLALARHRASVGGIGIIALYLQERRGWSAGLVQLVADIVICGAAFFITDAGHVALSVVSALALGAVMFTYHRPGRYTGY